MQTNSGGMKSILAILAILISAMSVISSDAFALNL